MVSVMSASRYVRSASRYQSRPSMYILGLIPGNWPRQFRLTCQCVLYARAHYLIVNILFFKFDIGDQLTIIDGITNKERDGCNITPNETIQFNGSIVAIKFTPGVTGHGYLLSYLSIQKRDLQFSK